MNFPTTFFGWVAFLAEKYGPDFMRGLGVTLQLATIGTVLGCVLGFVVGMVRSAIGGIDKGQMEGGQAIGMSYLQIMLHVIIPQAFRNLIPQIVN